jgi:NADPH:quinone reductase-like Zn-dependent oxidoreductase
MRAAVIYEAGPPDVLKVEQVERPVPIQTEVLVKVAAAGINPVEWKVRAGEAMPEMLESPPAILGWDVAGTVEELTRGVTRFEVGERVFGMPYFPRPARAYAEFVTAPSRQLARTPEKLSDEEAAALPLAGLTAWQSLVDTADVGEGDRVLVHAAAGGVGHIAVQIAKARGAHVIGTARSDKHAFLAELGVDEAIDYTERAFEDAADEVDVVLDLIGDVDYGLRSLATLKDGGLLISVPGGVPETVTKAAAEQGKRTTGIQVEPDGHALEQMAALVDADQLRVFVEESFPLERAAEAHARLESGRARGKYVLTP